MTRDKIYIVHILECITRIEEYTQAGKHDFETFSRTQDAVIRNLHVLSESKREFLNQSENGTQVWIGAAYVHFGMSSCMII